MKQETHEYSNDYLRLSQLGDNVKSNIATKEEKDEYMNLMLKYEKITQQQYSDYKQNKNADEILNGALTIGAIFLLGYVLKALVEDFTSSKK